VADFGVSHNGAILTSGAVISTGATTLVITAVVPVDATGIYLGFSAAPTPTIGALLDYPGSGLQSHSQAIGEAEQVYAHLVTYDAAGNQQVTTVGPFAVDGPATPDLIALDNSGWRNSGGSLVARDYAVARRSVVDVAPQSFYVSWDATALRLDWLGAHWDGDGDLFVYLDTGSGGNTTLHNPYTTTKTIHLPNGMNADYLIQVEDSATATLLQANGGNWTVVAALDASNFRLRTTDGQIVTELYLPFARLGYAPGNALKIVAVASEENELLLWAAAPDKNPLNSARAIGVTATERTLDNFALTHALSWNNLNLGQIPNNNRPAGSDLHLWITAEPGGAAVGYLDSSWLDLLTPGAPIDGDANGVYDRPLPLTNASALLGVGAGIQYTVYYSNTGNATAQGVQLQVTTLGGLSGVSNVTIGDIAPGVSGTVQLNGAVSGGAAAELNVAVSDNRLGAYDWLWVHHRVDNQAPAAPVISEPAGLLRANSQVQVSGIVSDSAGIAQVQLFVDGAPVLTCPDDQPEDAFWGCLWPVSDFGGAGSIGLQAQATDRNGNVSPLSNAVTLQVDASAPGITLSALSQAALADGILTLDEALLTGVITDDLAVAAFETCKVEDATEFCSNGLLTEGVNTPNGRWPLAVAVEGQDSVTQMLRLYGKDRAGNRSAPLDLTFLADGVGPVITVTHVVTTVTTPATLILSGTVQDGGGVAAVNIRFQPAGGPATLLSATLENGKWRLVLPTNAGLLADSYLVTVEAHDLADNVTASMAYGVALLPTAVNGAPVANAAGPYQVAEGESVVLSAALSSDPNEATSALTYTWDLAFDGNNFTADATGMTTTFTAVDGPLVQPIALRVTDSGGLIATTTSTVTVVNVSPHINVVDSAPQVVIGAALPITVTFSDSGVADSFAAIFAWGDTVTTSVNLPAGSTMVTTTHLYTADGAYEFTVTVRDNDGGSASTTKAVTVLPLPTPTPTATPTPIATETATPTPTETLTATPTETMTPINTPTETATPIATPTATLPSNGDSDGDTITDLLECDGNGATCADADGDGKPNQRDIDSDGDGIPDLIEAGIVFRSLDNAPLLDTDNDGVPDTLDTDADNDTVPDRIEGHDSNGDGFADRGPAGGDSDNDGLDDAYDTDASGYGSANAGASNAALGNTDSDTLDNWRDGDDDGDGLFTKDEVGPDAENPLDDDNNGVADYLQNTSILIKQLYLPMILK
jgi:hypothetical protein